MKIIRMLVGAALVAAVAAAIMAPAASSFAFVEGWVPVDGTVGVPYSWQFKSYGGCSDHRFSIHSGSLPAGLTLQSNGTISGTPTAAGTSSFWVWIDDKCGSQPAQRPFTLTIIPKLTVTTASPLAPAQVGAAYGIKLTAEGGGSQTWTVAGGALPPGFALAPDGTLSGTPAAALDAPASFVAMVTDGSRTDTKTIQLDVVAPLAVTPPVVAATEVGHALKPASATAAGGSRQGYAWSLVGNPAWLTIDPASGALAGTPTAAGTYPLQVAVKDAYGATATANIAVTVRGLVRVSTTRFAATRVGRQFRATLHTAGGVGPFRWKASGGKFPVGIRLTPRTGVLAGKPRQAGRFTVTFTVTDALGQTSEKSLTLDVKAKPKPKTKKK
jgi:hypothetical protein